MNRRPDSLDPTRWEKYFITVHRGVTYELSAIRFYFSCFHPGTGLHIDIRIISDCSDVREAMLAASNFTKGEPGISG